MLWVMSVSGVFFEVIFDVGESFMFSLSDFVDDYGVIDVGLSKYLFWNFCFIRVVVRDCGG